MNVRLNNDYHTIARAPIAFSSSTGKARVPTLFSPRFGLDSASKPDQFQAEHKTADLFAKALKNEGVDCVYGVPGEETLELLEALRKLGIRFITTRDEESAGIMAATHGRLTGKPGVCLTTVGPGAAKLVNPAAYATLGGMPMVMITAQKPIHHNKQGQFQIVDILGVLKPVTKSSQRVENGAMAPKLIRESFRQATSGHPGAVHIELPEDVASEPVDKESPLFSINNPKPPVADSTALDKAADLIANAKRPLILIGPEAKRQHAGHAIEAFIRKTGIPFITNQMGKGVIDENNPLYLGTTALSDNDYIHCATERADLILSIGHDPQEKPAFLMKNNNDQNVIHISALPANIQNIYFPQHEVVGDITKTMRYLARKLGPKSFLQQVTAPLQDAKASKTKTPSFDTGFFKRAIEFVHTHVADNAQNDTFPMVPQRIVTDVQKAMPKNGIVTLDNGMYKIWFARGFKAAKPDSLLLDNALATMGAGLPSAIEAARLNPNRKVLAVCGDGGLMMSIQELETAIREKLNLVVLVLKDNGFGMIQWKQQAHGLPEYGLKFGNPDFAKLAESFGAKGHKVTQTTELVPLLKQCFKAGGVQVIELPVDYAPNQTVLVDELKRKQCAI